MAARTQQSPPSDPIEAQKAALLKKFPASSHKTNPSGQTYVTVNTVIERLDAVMGNDWESEGVFTELVVAPDKTGRGKTQYMGTAGVHLRMFGKVAYGTGACINFDPDTAVKGAVSQAIKKAAVQFGVARYLQEEEERAEVAADQVAAGGDLQALKNTAYRFALRHESQPDLTGTPEQIAAKVAAVLGLGAKDMQEAPLLQARLTELGVL